MKRFCSAVSGGDVASWPIFRCHATAPWSRARLHDAIAGRLTKSWPRTPSTSVASRPHSSGAWPELRHRFGFEDGLRQAASCFWPTLAASAVYACAPRPDAVRRSWISTRTPMSNSCAACRRRLAAAVLARATGRTAGGHGRPARPAQRDRPLVDHMRRITNGPGRDRGIAGRVRRSWGPHPAAGRRRVGEHRAGRRRQRGPHLVFMETRIQ